MNADRLLARVGAIRLFSSLGGHVDDSSVSRILSWEEWPGPEEPRVESIVLTQQALHDKVVHPADEQHWSTALDAVAKAISASIPYDATEDAYHAPTMSVWFAAWTFSLEEAFTFSNLAIPRLLTAQIYWYERGHWPCALIDLEKMDEIGDYLVY